MASSSVILYSRFYNCFCVFLFCFQDAHNCFTEFDENTSLFAVYDGHGGHEVAEYAAKYLPDYIKEMEDYKNGNYEQALINAFLGFDATLATPEVVSILKQIVGSKDADKTKVEGKVDYICTSSYFL